MVTCDGGIAKARNVDEPAAATAVQSNAQALALRAACRSGHPRSAPPRALNHPPCSGPRHAGSQAARVCENPYANPRWASPALRRRSLALRAARAALLRTDQAKKPGQDRTAPDLAPCAPDQARFHLRAFPREPLCASRQAAPCPHQFAQDPGLVSCRGVAAAAAAATAAEGAAAVLCCATAKQVAAAAAAGAVALLQGRAWLRSGQVRSG